MDVGGGMGDVETHALVCNVAGFAHGAVLAEGGFEFEEGAFVGGAVAEDEVDFVVGAGGGDGQVVAVVFVLGVAGGGGVHSFLGVGHLGVVGVSHGRGFGFVGVQQEPSFGDDLFGEEVFGVILGVDLLDHVVAEVDESFVVFGGDVEFSAAEAVGGGAAGGGCGRWDVGGGIGGHWVLLLVSGFPRSLFATANLRTGG